jgi:hypothetical protein
LKVSKIRVSIFCRSGEFWALVDSMKKIEQLNWNEVNRTLNTKGFAQIPRFLSDEECEELKSLYGIPECFRNVIDMKRYRFGMGEYKYFSYPLPPLIQTLREQLYERLVPVANEWMSQLGIDISYPEHHRELIERCKEKGQLRPTPLILNYHAGGFNTLHQDLYGEVYFPFQVVFVLTQPGTHHTGGEFVITEQVPRAQSKAEVITPDKGDAVIFTTNFRPVKGTRGYYRATMKHGVSEVKTGERYSMGIIFHDAK